jgi:hypothetical protein
MIEAATSIRSGLKRALRFAGGEARRTSDLIHRIKQSIQEVASRHIARGHATG